MLSAVRKAGSPLLDGVDIYDDRTGHKHGTLSRSLRVYQTGSATDEVVLRIRQWLTIDLEVYRKVYRQIDRIEFNLHWRGECWAISRADFARLVRGKVQGGKYEIKDNGERFGHLSDGKRVDKDTDLNV